MTLLLTLLLAGPVQQGALVGGEWSARTFHNPYSTYEHGHHVRVAGDMDGDGFDDWLTTSSNGWMAEPEASILSGRTGAVLLHFTITSQIGQGSWPGLDTIEDLDGDGVREIIVGIKFGVPKVKVYSGATGNQLYVTSRGYVHGNSIATVDDVDGDGYQDYLVGEGHGAVLQSGIDGALLRSYPAAGRATVTRLGDVDGDGMSEHVVSNYYLPNGPPGSVTVYSGASGAVLYRFRGTMRDTLFGYALDDGGDLDGDGVPDLLVGAPGKLNFYRIRGTVYAYSGATGELIHANAGRHGARHGFSVSAAGDMNDDGHDDYLVGAPDIRHVYLVSGATGMPMREFHGSIRSRHYGISVAGNADLDGVWPREFAVGSPFEGEALTGLGAILVHRLEPILRTSADELSTTPGGGIDVQLRFPASEADQRYLLLTSRSGRGPVHLNGLDIPLTGDLLFVRSLSGGTGPAWGHEDRGTLDAAGHADARLRGGPAFAGFVGMRFDIAAISVDRATLAGRMSSVARSVTVVP